MSKYKIINLSSFCVALFATIIFRDLNPASANNTSSEELKLSKTIISNQNLSENDGSWGIYEQKLPNMTLKPILQQREESSLLVVDSNPEARDTNIAESKRRLTRLVFLSFLLLIFVPLGIFYPLFLFYRKLLDVDQQKSDYSPKKNYEPKFLEYQSPAILGFEAPEDTRIATVSKLQIAFSPKARRLRQKLEEISSSADLNLDQDIVELMSKTLSALISQQDWTHVSYCSIALPLEEIQAEFDLISLTERNKCISKKLSLLNHHQKTNDDNSSRQDLYRYVVVTLILCTTHNVQLFNKIHTEEQLMDELAQLGKMRKDSLIRFELLWNPQPEDQYINNDQLLTEYSDMNRLL